MQNNPETNGPGEENELAEDELDQVSGGSNKSSLDSLSDIGETDSVRRQQLMDRRSKYFEALSNLENKMSKTSSTITDKLK